MENWTFPEVFLAELFHDGKWTDRAGCGSKKILRGRVSTRRESAVETLPGYRKQKCRVDGAIIGTQIKAAGAAMPMLMEQGGST
jgi:hypothetical protein